MLEDMLYQSSDAIHHLIASAVSLIFNPYMFAAVLFPISYAKEHTIAYALLSVVSLALFPLIWHSHKVKKGSVNWNVDEQWKRPPLLFLSALGGFLGYLLLRSLDSYYVAIATLIYATTAFAVAVASYAMKVSVHTSTAVTSAIIVGWSLGLKWGIAMGVLALLVAWSRLILKAHRPVEVAEAYAISSLTSILVLSSLKAIPL